MASKRIQAPSRQLITSLRSAVDTQHQSFSRTFATTTEGLPPLESSATTANPFAESLYSQPSDTSRPSAYNVPTRYVPPRNPFITDVYAAAYSFPSMEPVKLIKYPSTHLALPLRRDILHRAVVYEADNSRAGTASTKWRNEIHGSGRKLRPQKGTGKARLGDRGSPMLRGGAKAFGPKPRDFSTDLPQKIYDLAFRTALSHRYRSGELTIIDGIAEIDVHEGSAARYMKDLLAHNGMCKAGKPIIVTAEPRPILWSAMMDSTMARDGKVKSVDDVDVKNLLEMGRLVIEREALEWLLWQHEADVHSQHKFLTWKEENDSIETS